MRINPFAMPIVIIVALFGTVFTAQAMGQWSTSGRVAIDRAKMTAADLKGWMTLQDVMDGLQISQSDLYATAKIPNDTPPTTALNKLEALVPGFSVTTLREALTAELGALPASNSAVAMPSQTSPGEGRTSPPPESTAAPVSGVAAATPTAAKGTGSEAGTGPTPLPAGQILPASQIRGSMTLQSVSQQCAVPLSQVIAGLNLPAETNPDTLIKDLVGQGKISQVTDVQKVVAGLQNQ